jgi:hypothetical protein
MLLSAFAPSAGVDGLRSLLSRSRTKMFKHLFAAALLASLLSAAVPASAQVEAKWFVLRNHEVGNCWTATLVRLDGQYTSTFERKAGGPYDTEEQALARLKSLSDQGTCNRD